MFPGSIGYLGKLAGSFLCGFASEYFGRRNSMILINIPHFITFYLFYFSNSIWEVFIATTVNKKYTKKIEVIKFNLKKMNALIAVGIWIRFYEGAMLNVHRGD